MLISLLATAGFGQTPTAPGQAEVVDREYMMKAAYLYKFATYVRWPDRAFADPNSPFVIAVFGPDPVGDSLRKIAAVKKIEGREIVVRHFKQLGHAGDFHILFMSRAVDSKSQKAAIQQLTGRNVLSVGETKDFLRDGGVIDFLVQENRLRVYISQSAYEREGLWVSAQFLRVVTVLQ